MIPMREFPTSETTKIKLKATVFPVFTAVEFRLEQFQEPFHGAVPFVVVFMSTTLPVSLQVCSGKALRFFSSRLLPVVTLNAVLIKY